MTGTCTRWPRRRSPRARATSDRGVWFWPIVVVVGCVLAGLRLHETELDRRLARSLALVAVLGVAVTGSGEELHGRPGVSDGQYVLLALVLAFVAWGLVHLVRRREGWFGYFVIALAAIWEGASLVGVLTHGFVLIARRRSWPAWPSFSVSPPAAPSCR
jgi:hypothetical protein